jgi:hypothetical protein
MKRIKLSLAAILAATPLVGCMQKFEHIHPPENQKVYYNDTEANQFLNSFPTKIPGAQSVEKFPFPGSEHVLVHLRIFHPVPNPTEEETRQINISQKNIYQELDFIHSNLGINYIYDEPILVETLESHNRTLNNLRAHKRWKEKTAMIIIKEKRPPSRCYGKNMY